MAKPKPQFCQTDIMVLFSLIVTCFDIVSVKQRADTDRPSPDGERRSPSEDEADEKTSSAEIHNAEDHKEIFQPKNHICMLNRFFFFLCRRYFGLTVRLSTINHTSKGFYSISSVLNTCPQA